MGKDIIFPVLAGIAFAALALGSSSQILAVSALIIFIIVQSISYFLRDQDDKELRHSLIMNSIIFIIGPLAASALIRPIFESGGVSLSIMIAFLLSILFTGLLYVLKRFIPDRNLALAALASLLVIGLALYAATPVGDYVRNIGKAGFEIAQYNRPLDRTIAEQGGAATVFEGQMGFIAQSYFPPASLDSPGSLFNLLMFIVLTPFAVVANLALGIFVALANLFLGTKVEFTDKAVSLLLFWLVSFWIACIYSAWRFVKREGDALSLFFLAIVMPPFVVGLIKAKYTIYAAVLLAVAIGFSFGQVGSVIIKLFKDLFKEETLGKAIYLAPLAIGAMLVILQFFSQGFAPSLIWGSAQTLYQNNPDALAPRFGAFCNQSGDPEVCAAAQNPAGYAAQGTNYQYSWKLCMLSIFSNYSYLSYMFDGNPANDNLVPPIESTAAGFRCQRLSDYWVESMEWIRDNTEPGARITSWWDYGHWINYFGERNAVVRNEHASQEMIGAVAHGYVDAPPEELKEWMEAHDTEYALFDIELVSGGGALGGKYGALNYLSCARDNLTSVNKSPGESQCEAEHLWENIFISHSSTCTISSLTGKTGFTAYKMYEDVYEQGPDNTPLFIGTFYRPYYQPACIAPQDPRVIAYCRNYVHAVPAYCVGNATLATGGTMFGTYYLNETYPNGDLKLSKGLLQMPYSIPATSHMGDVTAVTVFYSEDQIWLENGIVKSGYEDRKGKFYDSALYRAIFMDDLPGFRKVYETSGGEVKIYRIED
jgi:asparagine N-glycosylation enzyme membrane subunit Stt3